MGPIREGKQFVEMAKAFMRRQVKNCHEKGGGERGHKFRGMDERALERKYEACPRS